MSSSHFSEKRPAPAAYGLPGLTGAPDRAPTVYVVESVEAPPRAVDRADRSAATVGPFAARPAGQGSRRESRSLPVALERILLQGSLADVEDALSAMPMPSTRRQLGFRNEVLRTLASREDATMLACLRMAHELLKDLGSPRQILREAIESDDASLARAATLLLDAPPSTPDYLSSIGEGMGAMLSAIDQWPHLERNMAWDTFRHVFLDALLPAVESDKTDELEALIRRFPLRAESIALACEADGPWAEALRIAPLPISAGFWAAAVERKPRLVEAAFRERPEAIDARALTASLGDGSGTLLKAACSANPRCVNAYAQGETAAHAAARRGQFRLLAMLSDAGACLELPNRQGVTARDLVLQQPRQRSGELAPAATSN